MFFYCYPINHSNLFLLLYKFSIFLPLFIKFFFYCYSIDHSNLLHLTFFYFFSLSFFYCYPINHSNLFFQLYKFSIFYLFLLSFFYYYPINHSNLFLLLYWYKLFLTIRPIRPKVIHYKMDYLLKVNQTLWKTQAQFLPYILWPKFDHSHV